MLTLCPYCRNSVTADDERCPFCEYDLDAARVESARLQQPSSGWRALVFPIDPFRRWSRERRRAFMKRAYAEIRARKDRP